MSPQAGPAWWRCSRDGQLINSQQVISGLQALDTKVLPAGIYEVELRVLEDGQVTERRREMITSR